MRDEMGEWTDAADGEDVMDTGQTEAPADESADEEHVSSVAVEQNEPAETVEQAEPDPPAAMHAAPIRTVLKQFCERFTVDVGPLIEPIRQATETLTRAGENLTVRSLLPDLRDLLHHVRVLTEKVAEQQAYVLIFGPLKSGKSTFMNAICSAYVSEVTSLPAYPCIVNVTHDTTPSFMVTRYDGQSETHTEQGDVYEVIQQAHSDLMATIRRIEDDGDDFDPAIHMPQAIRKIDVRLPTGDLSESGAVLVDTPGLYSRMKFGYDRLTRDFRNAAACAIFIVKTDNLFLEQVFAEFHELLDLFSRVFLIVNLDTTKKDLDPSGDLVPSLEHDDPGRIIDAFTDLAMSAPLKAAADAGRLQIYPVDLLGAASQRIRTAQPTEDDLRRAHGQENFETLLTDLTDYLNSSEYLRAFLNDSLRRAGTLLGDLGRITQHETVGELVDEVDSLQQVRAETLAQREAIERLRAIDWTEQSDALHRFLLTQAQEQADEVRRITGHALVGAIDEWFENDQSLATLKDDEIDPLLNTCRKQFIHFLRGEMAQQMPGMRDAIAVSGAVLNDAETVDIDLGALTRSATEDASPAAALMPIRSSLNCEQIPVHRRFWDWLLMRSKTSVRRRLFGPSGSPGRRITPAAKDKRLGQLGQETMQRITSEQFDVLIDDATTSLPRELVTSYVANLAGPLARAIADRDTQTAEKLADIEARLAEAQRILAELKSLAGYVETTSEAVTTLKQSFGFEDIDHDASEDEDDGQYVPDGDGRADEDMDPVVAVAGDQMPDALDPVDDADQREPSTEAPVTTDVLTDASTDGDQDERDEPAWAVQPDQSPEVEDEQAEVIDQATDPGDQDMQDQAAQDTDEFDDLYAPYVAEASALPTPAADDSADADDTAEADEAGSDDTADEMADQADEANAEPEDAYALADDDDSADEASDDDAADEAAAEPEDACALADTEPVTKDQAIEVDDSDDLQGPGDAEDDASDGPADETSPDDSPDDAPWDAEATVSDTSSPVEQTEAPEPADEYGATVNVDPTDADQDPAESDETETDLQGI